MQRRCPQKEVEWRRRAALKNAIVPAYFEVTATNVAMNCGKCETLFRRNLIPGADEPTFTCPNCRVRNWVPVTFETKNW